MGDSTELDTISSQDDRSTLDRDFVPSSPPSSSVVTDDEQSVITGSRTIMETEGGDQALVAEGQGNVEEGDGANRSNDIR